MKGQGSDDTVWLVLIAAILGPAMLVGLGANVLAPVRTWLVERQILTTDAVLVPIGEGAGLDLARIVLVAAVLALLVTLVVLVAVRRHRRLEVESR